MFLALSSFWFWRGNTGPGSRFSAPSDPFQKNFLHIHRVIFIVDLITKICCRMYKTICTYCELPPSFPTLPVHQTHEVIVANNNFLSLLHWKSWKREKELTVLFCTFDKMSFNLRWARKTYRFDSVNDAVPGNHLPCRIHTYK